VASAAYEEATRCEVVRATSAEDMEALCGCAEVMFERDGINTA
jgi:hypothetical protein